jgi:streptogramin lyase
LARLELATHDVAGDSKGNIWYSPHRNSYIGRLDPRTGAVQEFHIPLESADVLPGTHWIHVDRNDIVWGSENWGHNIYRFDPKTADFKRIPWKVSELVNSPGSATSPSIRTDSFGAPATKRSPRSMPLTAIR